MTKSRDPSLPDGSETPDAPDQLDAPPATDAAPAPQPPPAPEPLGQPNTSPPRMGLAWLRLGARKKKAAAPPPPKSEAPVEIPEEKALEDVAPSPDEADSSAPPPRRRQSAAESIKDLSDLATSLWYLKTKYFKRRWDDDTLDDDDDPRARRALGRLNTAIEALERLEVQVDDPVGRPYRAGAQDMMQVVEFLPQKGLDQEVVTETLEPMVFWMDRRIQKAKVFVAAPWIDTSKQEPSAAETEPISPADPNTQTPGLSADLPPIPMRGLDPAPSAETNSIPEPEAKDSAPDPTLPASAGEPDDNANKN